MALDRDQVLYELLQRVTRVEDGIGEINRKLPALQCGAHAAKIEKIERKINYATGAIVILQFIVLSWDKLKTFFGVLGK